MRCPRIILFGRRCPMLSYEDSIKRLQKRLPTGYTGTWTDNFARGLQWIGANQEWRSALNLNASGQIVAPSIGLAAVSEIEAVQ